MYEFDLDRDMLAAVTGGCGSEGGHHGGSGACFGPHPADDCGGGNNGNNGGFDCHDAHAGAGAHGCHDDNNAGCHDNSNACHDDSNDCHGGASAGATASTAPHDDHHDGGATGTSSSNAPNGNTAGASGGAGGGVDAHPANDSHAYDGAAHTVIGDRSHDMNGDHPADVAVHALGFAPDAHSGGNGGGGGGFVPHGANEASSGYAQPAYDSHGGFGGAGGMGGYDPHGANVGSSWGAQPGGVDAQQHLHDHDGHTVDYGSAASGDGGSVFAPVR